MKNLFEISFFNEGPDPVKKIFCDDLQTARNFVEARLCLKTDNCYTATVWNTDPKCFLCFYLNDKNELFWFQDPIVLTREQAAKLRKGGLENETTGKNGDL